MDDQLRDLIATIEPFDERTIRLLDIKSALIALATHIDRLEQRIDAERLK